MADQQIGDKMGLTTSHVGDADSRSNITGSTDPESGFDDADLDSISAMRTRLAAIDASYYTTARLDQMTHNDMVYAIRVNDHPSTIKQ